MGVRLRLMLFDTDKIGEQNTPLLGTSLTRRRTMRLTGRPVALGCLREDARQPLANAGQRPSALFDERMNGE